MIEWSSENHQIIIQPWVPLADAATLDDVIRRIATHQRQRAGLKTAMGRALGVAGAMLEQQSHCWTHTIDVSGDGRNNIGPVPAEVYLADAFDRVVVNALVVGDPMVGDAEGEAPGMTTQELRQYFEDEVIRGPGSFAIVADGYIDFARAMHLKLMRELSQPILGQLSQPTSRG